MVVLTLQASLNAYTLPRVTHHGYAALLTLGYGCCALSGLDAQNGTKNINQRLMRGLCDECVQGYGKQQGYGKFRIYAHAMPPKGTFLQVWCL